MLLLDDPCAEFCIDMGAPVNPGGGISVCTLLPSGPAIPALTKGSENVGGRCGGGGAF